MSPTKFEDAAVEIRKKAEAEYVRADRELRKKRSDVSIARHNTYMDQARRVPRSLEDQIERRKALEKDNEIYVKPDMETLLELVGGDMRMTNLPGVQGVKLRELLAHRALYAKDKLHNRAVAKKITSPKKFSFVEHYIAPIWRENVINSSDDESEDEDEKAMKAADRAERKAERTMIAKAMMEERAIAAEAAKFSVKTEKRSVKLEDAMGKPRKKIELAKHASDEPL